MDTESRIDPHERILIRTKLNRPQLPVRQVVRPRLLEKLDSCPVCRTTLISAPAGYGKTTVALQYFERSGGEAAWLSLDRDDNDPDRFSRYLVAAVQGARPESMARSTALLSAPSAPPWPYFAEVVVGELAEIEDPFVLVLDDYQSIASTEIHELVSNLVENLSQNLHLVILSRVDPPLPLARWRGRGWLNELRMGDLRFDPDEVRRLFAASDGLGLSEQEVDVLGRKTEGWIAGLQLARLSLARASDPHEMVQQFSGSDRLVADYLVEEVLAAQPREIRELLSVTCRLERFCAPLCEWLLTDGSCQAGAAGLLDQLERENLFLIPLDAEHRWFRYHHLFRQLLANHLREAASEDSRRDIARRAAEWFAGQGLTKEALQLWVAAGELDAAASHLGSQLHAILDEDYSVRAVRRLLALFPPGAERGRPPLLVAHAYAAVVQFDLPRLGSLLDQADACLEVDPHRGASPAGDLRADLDALRAFLHAWRGEPEVAIEHGTRALARLPDDDLGKARLSATIYTGASMFLMGRREECVSFFQQAIRDEDLRGGKRSGGLRFGLAHLHLMANDLTGAHVLVQQAAAALEARATADYFLGETTYLLGALALERDLIDEAEDHFQRLVGLRYLFIAWAYQDTLIGLALVAERRGDREAVMRWAREARLWAMETGNEDCLRASESFDRRLAARDGAAELTVPAPAPVSDAVSIRLEVPSITHAEVLMTHPEAEIRRGALPYIDEAIAAMESVFNARQVLRLSVLRAVALAEAGRREEATDELDAAVARAEPQGSIRPLLGGGGRTAVLLEELARRRPPSAFLSRVLRAHGRGPAAAASIEPLTLNEVETLAFVAEHLTNKEIAQRLNVSAEAIKKRLAQVYLKLDVHGRREAVAEAVARGILRGGLR